MLTYLLFALMLGLLALLFPFLIDKEDREEAWIPAIIVGICSFLFWGALNWLLLPVISPDTPAMWIELALSLCFYGCLSSLLDYSKAGKKIIIGLAAAGALGLAFVGLYSWDIFHSSKKYNLLQVEETQDSIENTISPIPVEKMAIINENVARALVNQKMNDLGNRCEIGTFTKQSFTGKFTAKEFNGNVVNIDYQNQIVYVAPLEHTSFWKWKKYRHTEGYALVNASDPSEYYLICEVNGEPLKLKYLESAHFGDNIERYVRTHGFQNKRLSDFGIELDENGRPFNVISVLENQIMWGTPLATGSVIVDVQTGDIKEYDIEHTPSFVNLVQPRNVVEDLIYYWGEYVHGYVDFSDKDRKRATPGMDIVHDGKDGCCYYVGIQSKANADSDAVATIGFLKINTITGKATFFKREGINEPAAKKAMAADISVAKDIQLGTVELDDAVFYNIEGIPTYFATFISTKDNMPKYYGFCSAYNKEVVGVGTSLQSAKAAYLKSRAEYEQRQGLKSSAADVSSVTRKVTVAEKVQEGNCYYFRFNETGDTVFYAFSELLPEVRWHNEKPTITYRKSNETSIALSDYSK